MAHFLQLLLVLAVTVHTLAQSVPDLQSMLTFTRDWTIKDSSWSASTPVCNWVGVGCAPGNNGDRVTSFTWYQRGCNGTVNMTNLPVDLEFLDLSENYFTGEQDLNDLPTKLKKVTLDSNRFTGNLTENWSGLPVGLTFLDLSNNLFTGKLILRGLPAGLKGLYLGKNQFTGKPILSDCPASLTALDLAVNMFSGTPILTGLPVNLTFLDLSANKFTSSSDTPLDLSSLPRGMTFVQMLGNYFHGIPILTNLPAKVAVFIQDQAPPGFCGNTSVSGAPCSRVISDGTCQGEDLLVFRYPCA